FYFAVIPCSPIPDNYQIRNDQRPRHPKDLYSVPTRRSSDLLTMRKAPTKARRVGKAIHIRRRTSARQITPRSRSSPPAGAPPAADRKSTRLNSSHVKNSYAVFCLKKTILLMLK